MIRKAVIAIVFQHNKYLIVNKTKINTNEGKEDILGEWDFVKGGIKEEDNDLRSSILRELKEETGSSEFNIIKQFNDNICFDFPEEIKVKIGYEKQEIIMFLIEFFGDSSKLVPLDNEICTMKFLEKEELLKSLTHSETKTFFKKVFS